MAMDFQTETDCMNQSGTVIDLHEWVSRRRHPTYKGEFRGEKNTTKTQNTITSEDTFEVFNLFAEKNATKQSL